MSALTEKEKFVFVSGSGVSLFRFDCREMGLEDALVHCHGSQLSKALQAMRELEAGALANPDEGRQVGHYWLRDPKLAPSREIAQAIEDNLQAIKDFSRSVLDGQLVNSLGDQFTDLVVVGIGGSALGPQLVYDALSVGAGLVTRFLDNTDPDGALRELEALTDLSRTLFLIVSKSGGTRETYNGEMLVKQLLRDAGLNPAKQLIAITQEGSALHDRVRSEGWLTFFPLWDWVGGRTSVMSSVGLVPAALQGVDLDQFLSGARAMDQWTRSDDPYENPALMMALSWFVAGDGRGNKNMVVLPYRDRLLLLSRYLQQLVMESLGKKHDSEGAIVEQGLSVFGNKGSTDQHAFVQQLRDGRNDFFVVFAEVLGDGFGLSKPDLVNFEVERGVRLGDYLQGFLLGTRRALSEGGRSSCCITLGALNAENLGRFIALFERAVGFYATMININAYHQPGVEAGKIAAGQILELQQRVQEVVAGSSVPVSIDEIVGRLSLGDRDACDIWHIVERLQLTGRLTLVHKAGGETAFVANNRPL